MEAHKTLYLDLEDDITAIISKVNAAPAKTLKLVVPKRSSVLESVVNLKLLKKSAATASKQLSLITDDPKINIMAGRLGILTAPNLKAEPTVPQLSEPSAPLPSSVIEDTGSLEAVEAPVAVAAAAVPKAAASIAAKASSAASDALNKAKAAKSKIPDFNRFKKRMLLFGVLGVGLIFLLWAALFALPQANILVSGRTEPVKADFNFTLDTKAAHPNLEQAVLPGISEEISKTLSDTFTPTGRKDVGSKATGTVTIENCQTSSASSHAAGTGFTAPNGKVFLSDSSFTVPGAAVSGGGVVCATSDPINVSAAENGSSYNQSASDEYTSSSFKGKYTISGSDMTGGNTKTVTVVSKDDINQAKRDLLDKEKADSQAELKDRFDKEDYVIAESFSQKVTEVSSSPAAGQESDGEARLTVKVTYLQYGVKTKDIKDLLRFQMEKLAKEKNSDLGVADEGLDQAQFVMQEKVSSAQSIELKTTGLLGPSLNFDQLKDELAGKKSSEVVDKLKSFPNVTGVKVNFSPFWVRSVPHNPAKVTIKLDVAK